MDEDALNLNFKFLTKAKHIFGMLNLKTGELEYNKISYLNFDGDEPIMTLIRGRIVNSVDENKERSKAWKEKITREIIKKRDGVQNNEKQHAISVSMKFHLKTHGGRKLDAENFLKPILDAVAAGLFASEDINPSEITRYDFDDSNFDNVYFEKLTPAVRFEDECVIITISQKTT